ICEAAGVVGSWPPNFQLQGVAGNERQFVRFASKDDQTFKLMITVCPTLQNMERQIDFRWSGFGKQRPDRNGCHRRNDQPPSPGFFAFAASTDEAVSSGSPD